jgi:hypothetical protein
MDEPKERTLPSLLLSVVLLNLVVALPACQGGERIKVLVVGQILDRSTQIPDFLADEPLVDFVGVPARGDYIPGGQDILMKYIRQYFPRTYEDLKLFEYILLTSPEYYLLTTQQDMWMHDAIYEGAGGFNDASVFSIVAQIHNSWAASAAQLAFPNDAPAVVARGGGGASPTGCFTVRVNRDFPEPVLSAYLPFGIEQVICSESRFIIPRDGSEVIAWQEGNFPGLKNVPYLVVWDYGQGRTMTIGDAMHKDLSFFRYPRSASDNTYAPDILTNMILYSTGRDLIEDVEVFHSLKSQFISFRAKLAVLISLGDFVDRFGANTQGIQEIIWDLEEISRQASEQYLDQDFVECENTMALAFEELLQADAVAKDLKDAALTWVYITEWLVTSATLMVSGYVLWTLMLRRKLYREVDTTKFL